MTDVRDENETRSGRLKDVLHGSFKVLTGTLQAGIPREQHQRIDVINGRGGDLRYRVAFSDLFDLLNLHEAFPADYSSSYLRYLMCQRSYRIARGQYVARIEAVPFAVIDEGKMTGEQVYSHILQNLPFRQQQRLWDLQMEIMEDEAIALERARLDVPYYDEALHELEKLLDAL